MQKQRRNYQETIVQRWGKILVPPRGIYITIPLSSSTGNKIPTHMEDGNFRLSTRYLEYHPVTLPPTNQNKVTHTAALTLNFSYKNFSLKTIREFGVSQHESPILLVWHSNKHLSPPTPAFQFVWLHCVLGTQTWVW